MENSALDALDSFQRYMARESQIFSHRTTKETSMNGLGWMRIENYIYAKKIVFIRKATILLYGMYQEVMPLIINEKRTER